MIARIKGMLASTLGFNPAAWVLYARRMRRSLLALPVADSKAEQLHVIVAVIPWLGTGIPWLSLAVGRMLAATGVRVTFALDDWPFEANEARRRMIIGALGWTMRGLEREHRILRLSDASSSEDELPLTLINELAEANATWEKKGEIVAEGRAAIERRNHLLISQASGPIASVLDEVAADVLFLPGGVFGTSGVWNALARSRGMRVASFDNGGFGTWMVATDGLACHHGDIARATKMLYEQSAPAELASMIKLAAREIEARRQGVDLFAYQIKGSIGGLSALSGGLLLALNSSWDSAALGIHKVFSSNIEWILETVNYLLHHTTAPIIVRQHPAERFDFARTTDDYGSVLRARFGDHPRLHFIAAADPVNSYALLEQVNAVLVHSSTIGNEAAAMGVPVITASNAYFAAIGFVEQASTREEYFALLDRAASGRLKVSLAQRKTAQLCYFVTQVSNWVRSDFNPEQFKLWHRRPLGEWLTEPAIARMIEAIVTNVPVAVLNRGADDPPASP